VFTGIIKDLGNITLIKRTGNGMEIGIKSKLSLNKGDSVSINGICLTVKSKKNNMFLFDISAETLNRSNINNWKIGDWVNLEPAITPNEALSGHIVQGHIDGAGKITLIKRIGNNFTFEISIPDELMAFIVKKGSIAIDGISLTVAYLRRNNIAIAIIPYTFENTNLKYRKVGNMVNIETDIIGKYVKKFMEAK